MEGGRGRAGTHLQSLPADRTSQEIKSAIPFLNSVLRNPAAARAENPCTTAGDLLIALESAGLTEMYTMNCRESQHLCRALGQTMVYLPPDSQKEEMVCDRTAAEWPAFGGSTTVESDQ